MCVRVCSGVHHDEQRDDEVARLKSMIEKKKFEILIPEITTVSDYFPAAGNGV